MPKSEKPIEKKTAGAAKKAAQPVKKPPLAAPAKKVAARKEAKPALKTIPAPDQVAGPVSEPKAPISLPAQQRGQVRAVIDKVLPSVDAGRFAIKRIAGEPVLITAHCFADGHDVLRVMLQWRRESDAQAHEVPMTLAGNDEWHAAFTPPTPGRYAYRVAAWVDPFESWRHELTRRVDAQDIRIAAQVGAMEIAAAAERAEGADRASLAKWSETLARDAASADVDIAVLKALALDESMALLAERYPDRRFEAISPVELPLWADRERARFSSWYELFPRSASPEPGRHGTFKDVEARLPAIAKMGFDVLYFPPIHPIGRVNRKGRNNVLTIEPGDVGSPWAIGAEEGGHKAILSELGTAKDFRALVAAAKAHNMEIALDIAFQCAPDHPYVKQHPDWFRWRPDGTVQYAENPPKKYQDIYPFNFESDDWRALWAELKSVFDHWIGEGVKIFRVDNPHTKAFPFWEWAITAIQTEHPDVLFLAEAFTRPKVMHRLAKLGYSQSYTYFTWRNSKQDLIEYFEELSEGPGVDYFRPNVWPNTPDILHAQLQGGQAPMYMSRLALAATLSASYGIYGPAFELVEYQPRGPGSEEYLDSEKYQLRTWDHASPRSIAPFISRINRIRRENPALHSNDRLRFLPIANDQMLAFAKTSADAANVVITVVNLDPDHVQSGWVHLDPSSIGVEQGDAFQVHDLLSNQRFMWQGEHHFVQLDPHASPAHIFVVRRRSRSERDFDYFI